MLLKKEGLIFWISFFLYFYFYNLWIYNFFGVFFIVKIFCFIDFFLKIFCLDNLLFLNDIFSLGFLTQINQKKKENKIKINWVLRKFIK
jgi:hypothetical protein